MPAQTVIRHRWSEIPLEAVTPHVARRFITGDRITVAQFELKRGGIVPRHSHESEQITCMISGTLKFTMDGQEVIVRGGEALQIPSGLAHAAEVLEDCVAIDVFSPVRQDWVDKTDHYFRNTSLLSGGPAGEG
jgi:quercetin dioxygenase-like cupin family protein